jgi:hypothetical protein
VSDLNGERDELEQIAEEMFLADGEWPDAFGITCGRCGVSAEVPWDRRHDLDGIEASHVCPDAPSLHS